MEAELSKTDAVRIFGVAERTIQRWAREESWGVTGINGHTRFLVSSLPAARRMALSKAMVGALPGAAAGIERAAGLAAETEAAEQAANTPQAPLKGGLDVGLSGERGLAEFACLPLVRRQEAEAMLTVLNAAKAFAAASKLPRKQALNLFCREFCAGAISLPEEVLSVFRRQGALSLSYSTLNRRQKDYDRGGLAALARDYTCKKESSVPAHMRDFIAAMLYEFPHTTHSKIVEALQARYAGQVVPSASAILRCVRAWKRDHQALLLYVTNPDKFKSHLAFAPGDASAAVCRLNQLWEMDSTPGDVMLKDGRHTVIGVIDVYSRRLKLLVSPTSKAAAIAALIRAALLDWGVPEAIKSDNGSDYTSHHIERVLMGLEIYHDLCAPFSPEQKPHIERALGTFSHDIVELLPGYIGHSVADRKDIEARRTFAARLMKSGADPVEIAMTSGELQEICNRWTLAVYEQNPHTGLVGKTPWQMASEWTDPLRMIQDERALDLLLSPAPKDGGWRTVGKKLITVENIDYMAPELAAMAGERVQVLLDAADLGTVYVYCEADSGGLEFVCRAQNPEFAGLSRVAMAKAVKSAQQRVMSEGKEDLKKIARAMNVKTIAREILEHREKQIANIYQLDRPAEAYSTPMLAETARAADSALAAARGPQPIEISEAEEKAAHRVIEISSLRKQRPRMPGNEQECYEMLNEEMTAGGALTTNEVAWMADYDYYLATGKRKGLQAAGFQPFAERQRMRREQSVEA